MIVLKVCTTTTSLFLLYTILTLFWYGCGFPSGSLQLELIWDLELYISDKDNLLLQIFPAVPRTSMADMKSCYTDVETEAEQDSCLPRAQRQ